MPRHTLTPEEKRREGLLLEAKLRNYAANSDSAVSQESLAHEMGISQGNFSQWVTGRTSIPDRRLIWLSKRLGFDPTEIRPTLTKYSADSLATSHERMILEAYRLDPDFRRTVDAVAEMSPFYKSLVQQTQANHSESQKKGIAKKKS